MISYNTIITLLFPSTVILSLPPSLSLLITVYRYLYPISIPYIYEFVSFMFYLLVCWIFRFRMYVISHNVCLSLFNLFHLA